MDATIHDALDHSQTVDITTTGRRSGEARRIEIVLHSIGGRLVISGTPRPQTRAWIYNLEADPRIVVHLKRGVQADVEGTARVVSDPTIARHAPLLRGILSVVALAAGIAPYLLADYVGRRSSRRDRR